MSNIKSIKDAQKGKENKKQGTPDQDELDPVQCSNEECESMIFIEARKFGRLSKLHPNNITGQVKLFPFQTFVCAQCGTELTIEE